jgi:hypothetical protein
MNYSDILKLKAWGWAGVDSVWKQDAARREAAVPAARRGLHAVLGAIFLYEPVLKTKSQTMPRLH